MAARQRPDAASRVADGMKVHRHVVRLGRAPYTVITLRPGTRARFSTNRCHEAWHVLSDAHGARLLGRLLWGLAYQRRPNTLVLLDRPYLDPNPFDGAPADPIALVPHRLTSWGSAEATELRRRLPLGGPAGTIRWRTAGLDAELATRLDWWERPPGDVGPGWTPEVRSCWFVRTGGVLTISGTPGGLRELAADTYRLPDLMYCGMGYTEDAWPTGEVQIFADYARRVTGARVARAEILAEAGSALPPADQDRLIWNRNTAVRRRTLRPAA